MIELGKDAEYFAKLQTETGWGRTLNSFAAWCAPEPAWLALDVGCGPGLLPAIFSRFACFSVGVDLDEKMFQNKRLHSSLAVADGIGLPFSLETFDLVTASNLLFLLSQPVLALTEMGRVLKRGGKVALLNPTENLSLATAQAFAQERGLEGLAHDTLLTWAMRAEENHRWTEEETKYLYRMAGLKYQACIIKVGPGFARFSWGTT